MSGVTEILLIIVIVLAIFFLPRLAAKRNSGDNYRDKQYLKVSGKMRIAILVSVIWPAAFAIIMEPWNDGVIRYICIGLAPVAFLWGVWWVIVGYRKDRS